MPKEPAKPKSGFTRRSDGGAHPVLAQLPDVSNHSAAPPRAARAAAAGFVDYRFDMAAGTEPKLEARPSSTARQAAVPHMFHRGPRSEYRPQSFGNRSRVLPDSDPFSIPATTLADRLAPLGRFLVMFVLFTTIATFMMTNYRQRSSSEPEQPRIRPIPAPAGMNQTLEPAFPVPNHPLGKSPSASGPLGAKPRPAAVAPPFENPTGWAEIEGIAPVPETAGLSERSPSHPPRLACADGNPLPQVQTTDPASVARDVVTEFARPEETVRPPAIARLPGVIFEAPRNAYHDQHQSGLY